MFLGSYCIVEFTCYVSIYRSTKIDVDTFSNILNFISLKRGFSLLLA